MKWLARYSATDVFPHPAGPVMIQMCRCCGTGALEAGAVVFAEVAGAIGVEDEGAIGSVMMCVFFS